MPPRWIVEAVDVTANGFFSLAAGLEAGSPDQFGFDGFEHGFDHRIVVTVSLSAH